LFVVLSIADLPRSDVYFVVPITPGTDTEAIDRALSVAPRYNEIGWVGQLFGNAFVVGRPATIKRLKAESQARSVDPLIAIEYSAIKRLQAAMPAPRPEIAAAFAAAPDKTAQLLFIPPAATRRAFAEIMPALPKEFGGGPTRALTEGIHWATFAVDL